MSEIFDNAIKSIILGVEDFETGNDVRMLSAARNYYAGVLLLAKECLVRAAPKADAMKVIGAKFEPKPDGDGGIDYETVGYTTVDLHQLKKRFKDFDLNWPDADINKLQRFRNELEHHHLKQPVSALSEAIASSFPMVVDFFNILGEDAHAHLGAAWDAILERREAFNKVQAKCLAALELVSWPAAVANLDRMNCPNCSSALIGQVNTANSDHEQVIGKCHQCGEEIGHEKMMEMIVVASYGGDAYQAAKDGLEPPITSCPDCGENSYVETPEASVCFTCGASIVGDCLRCGSAISVHNSHPEYSGLCSYCAYVTDKAIND